MLAKNTTIQHRFKSSVKKAYEESAYTNMKRLSQDAGMSPSQIENFVNGKFDDSKDGPGLFSIDRMADLLGTSIDDLTGRSDRVELKRSQLLNSHGPQDLSGAFTIAHSKSGGRLAGFAHLADYYDLYETPNPTDEIPKVVYVAKSGLLGTRIKSTSAEKANREISAMPKDLLIEACNFQRRVAEHTSAMDSDTFINHDMVTEPRRVRANYARFGYLVRSESGQMLILQYCLPIPV